MYGVHPNKRARLESQINYLKNELKFYNDFPETKAKIKADILELEKMLKVFKNQDDSEIVEKNKKLLQIMKAVINSKENVNNKYGQNDYVDILGQRADNK